MSSNNEIQTLRHWLRQGHSTTTILEWLAAAKLEVNDVHASAAKRNFADRLAAMGQSRYNEKELRLALGQLRSLGIEPDEDGRVNLFELDRVMAGKMLTPEK